MKIARHGHFPDLDPAQAFHGAFDVVFLAHGNTAAGDDHIGLPGGPFQGGHGGLQIIRYLAQIQNVTAQLADQAR